jgi:hypothetical protein
MTVECYGLDTCWRLPIRMSDPKEWLTGDEIADFESRIDAEESESTTTYLWFVSRCPPE